MKIFVQQALSHLVKNMKSQNWLAFISISLRRFWQMYFKAI